jgi:endonuclease G
VPGVSVCHPKGTAGTLGAIVYDRQTGAPCMLSNWHVLHGEHGRIGDEVVQPGPFDDNRVGRNRAGVLVRSHLGPAGDCAIARIENRDFDPTVYELGVKAKRIARPELGDLVVKSGRTTAVTAGIVRRVDVIAKIPYDGIGARNIGGFEIGPLEGAEPEYEVSMGGDSGSVWLAAEKSGGKLRATDVMVGLHFAGEGQGESDEHALACYAHSVLEKLEATLEPSENVDSASEAAGAGYDPDFLGIRIDVAGVPASKKADVVRFDSSDLIPYTHFSVCLSASRRFAHFVAWNIDGERLKAYGRKGLDFKLDPRIDAELQVDNDLYVSNKLDRGHIARRADLVWGPKAEAQRANRDSFYFTNIAPQHIAFNQSDAGGLWGELEDAIFEDLSVERARLSLMGGPIFKKNDPVYRGVRIPRSFWKLIAFVDAEDQTLKVKAYVLTQDDLLHDIEAFELDPFRMYQVSLKELAELAKLDFSHLAAHDTLEPEELTPEGQPARREVRELTRRSELIPAAPQRERTRMRTYSGTGHTLVADEPVEKSAS